MISVIMAAYNEERPLRAVLASMPANLCGHSIEILVVDDGSTDGTSDVARSFGCDVIRFDENRGKGAAIRRGLESLRASDCDAIVLMDSDGQHDPEAIERLLDPILEGEADLVVGSRYLTTRRRGSTPLNRYIVRTVTVAVIRRFFDVTISDPYSGFRALTPETAGLLQCRGNRYEGELEMIFTARHSQLRIQERPVPKIYGAEMSKMGSRRGAFLGRLDVLCGYIRTIVREAAASSRQSNAGDKDLQRS